MTGPWILIVDDNPLNLKLAREGDEQRALAAGCDGYIREPFDTMSLPEVVAQYMRRSA